MSIKLLTFEDGIVRIGGDALPGLLQNLKVSDSVRMDEQSVDKTSGKKKTPQGWEDTSISITLLLPTDDQGSCYDKLQTINGYFRQTDGSAKPAIFTVANRHMQARGVRQVVFSRLESSETSSSDEIQAQLAFTEHNPPVVKLEQAAASKITPKSLAQAARQAASKGNNAGKAASSARQKAEEYTIKADLK